MLGPPSWLKPEWLTPADRDSLALFQKFKKNAPRGVIPNGPTVQGVYVMTHDGHFLSGYFAWAFKNKAQATITRGWDEFERISKIKGWKPRKVPTEKLNHTLGEPLQGGAIKLQATVRDLPRGDQVKPGKNEFQECAYNVSWNDFSAQEVLMFVTDKKSKQPLPKTFIQRLSNSMKDCARGQCGDWKKEEIKQNEVFTELIKRDGSVSTMRITGNAQFGGRGRTLVCQIHGIVSYDSDKTAITNFDLVASGQRTGRDGANGRADDLGPAPIGFAYSMVQPE